MTIQCEEPQYPIIMNCNTRNICNLSVLIREILLRYVLLQTVTPVTDRQFVTAVTDRHLRHVTKIGHKHQCCYRCFSHYRHYSANSGFQSMKPVSQMLESNGEL